jgi:type I restriction enzyme S subunit
LFVTGIREGQNIDYSRLSRAELPLPPREEQTAIVRYLDWACVRLDRAVRAKRKTIASLHEQKRTIISAAVTRGIGPSVQLKHSGVDWIGEIPASWSVFRIKNVMRAVDRRSASGTEDLLSVRMHHGIVRFSEHFQRPPQARTLVNFKLVEPGQFVVNRMQAGNGLIFCSDHFGLVSPDYSVLDVVADVNKEFLGELMRSRLMRWKFRVESKGLGTGTSGFLRLYDDRLGSVHVALPPRHEQDSIMLELKGKLSGLVDATGRVQREMDLLREYRTRLIADVVTGKLDVREAAAKLPDAAVEPETALEQEPEELELEEELVEGE